MHDGHISLPNGLGLGPRTATGRDAVGVAPNELTSSDDRDWFAGTPLHKHVRARVEPVRVEPVVCAVRRTRFDDWPCPIARTTDLIGDWWTPLVLREAFVGRRRFDEFQESLDIPRAVLTARLEPAGRRGDDANASSTRIEPAPLRVPAHPKGRAFWDVLAAMWRWGSDWLWPDGQEPPVVLKDRETGEVVDPARRRRAHRRHPSTSAVCAWAATPL